MIDKRSLGERIAGEAASLIGVPFKLYGRMPATGMDCIGLVGWCLSRTGRQVELPADYLLRNTKIDRFFDLAQRSGLIPAKEPLSPGDIVLMTPGPAQHHLAIIENKTSMIHAHAGLRRVVRQPVGDPSAMMQRWRACAQ